MKKVLRIGAVFIGAMFVSGCALPVPIQVASWALDGISYVVTEKSITDHGLSVVTQKDCAVWRGLTEGEVCREWRDGEGILLASMPRFVETSISPIGTKWVRAGGYPNFLPLEPAVITVQSHIEERSEIKGIARPLVSRGKRAHSKGSDVLIKAEPVVSLAQFASIPPKDLKRTETVLAQNFRRHVKNLSLSSANSIFSEARDEPVEGVYFVIGSFRTYDHARSLAVKHSPLLPTVLTAKINRAPVYRVVVGPVEPGSEKTLFRRIARVGFQDTWAIRVQPGDWSLAGVSIKQVQHLKPSPELAKLPQ